METAGKWQNVPLMRKETDEGPQQHMFKRVSSSRMLLLLLLLLIAEGGGGIRSMECVLAKRLTIDTLASARSAPHLG